MKTSTMAHKDKCDPKVSKEVGGGNGAEPRSWSGPRTVSVHRAGGGFGFTLRHFIVYPPESAVQQLQEQEEQCEHQDGVDGKASKLSALDPMDTIFVKQVKEAGPAQIAGLHKGDRIISVNGESVTGKSYSQVIALIQSSQSTLKLLVVPKDEDILQMAYETSAYNQGREPYRGSAAEIPHPPQIYQDPPPQRTSRYKSEIRMVPEDLGAGGASPKPFDPRVPRQRLSTSSMASLSSGSSYSTSKDVGLGPPGMEVAMDTGDSMDVVMAGYPSVSGEAASGVLADSGSLTNAHKPHSSGARATQAPSSGASFTSDLSAAAAATNPSSLTQSTGNGGQVTPPTAPHRSSSRNVSYLNIQRGAHDAKDMPYSVPSQDHNSSRENLEQFAGDYSRRGSPASLQINAHGNGHPFAAPTMEKLLMTGHEARPRRSSRDSSRQSADNLTGASGHSNTPERQHPSTRLVSTTYLAPGASTTITVTPHSTSTSLSNLGASHLHRHPQPHHWPSDSQVCDMDTTPASEHCSRGHSNKRHSPLYSANDISYKDGQMSSSEQSLSTLGNGSADDSYGLTVSLHMDTSGHKSLHYTDLDSRPPINPGNPDRSQGERRINMVTERLRRYESSESVENQPQQCRRQRIPKRVGYDSVLSRAADFEHRHDDEKRKRSSRTSPYTTPTGSTSSLPQALPPAEIHKVPQTPPATINFYFRDPKSPGAMVHSSMANLEPSPEVTLYNPDNFRVRVSSEPPEIRSTIGRERSPLADISIVYGEGSPHDGLRHKGATRQPSYLSAVNTDQEHVSHSSSNMGTPPSGKSVSAVTLRERSQSEDREARLKRRTSYLLATGRHNQNNATTRVDVSQLVVPPPAVMPATGITPTKTSNIKKLKSLFGERTPRILEAITDRKNLFDMSRSTGGVALEGTLICKVAVTDGKRASDRSWKPAHAQLRGNALYLFRDRNTVIPALFEDHPISVKSSIVDIAYDYTKKKNVFRLTTFNGSEFLFQAEDHESMLQWIRVIQTQHSIEEQKDNVAIVDFIVPKVAQQQESAVVVNRSSPQVAPKGKKTSTRSLRSKSPSSHSPASKPKKQYPEKADFMDPAGPKSKDTKTWKDRMAKKFKRYGSSSSASADIPEGPSDSGITGSFGVPLDMVPCSSFNEYVPLVVEVCTKIVEERGLENQGIYRVPGNTGAVNQLQEECNRAMDIDGFDMENEKWMDVNVVSSLLKSFFRKLPEPLVTEELYQLMITANRTAHQEKRMLKIKKLLHELPDHNFETFHYMAEHLSRVADKGDLNKMDGRNLAIVFGPTLVRTSDDNMITMVTDMSDQCRIVESIITNCTWFFSSWSEDVNVPLDQNTDTVPVSGMNQELLVKAENLGMSERGRDVSVKDLMSSVIQAANRKIRKSKPKGESVDNDIESEPPSYNERNIDREIELRKGQVSQNVSMTKDSSSLSLEQHTSLPTSLSVCMSTQDSKSSLSLDQGGVKETSTSNLSLKSSSSSLAVLSPLRPDHSPSQEAMSSKASQDLGAGGKVPGTKAPPIKRYPAYPKVDFSSPQIDNSKPMILKKYASDELTRGDWRRDNDEVKKTYGLTPQTRQHLRRIELETQALRRREEEKQRDQVKNAQAKKRIEMELQKTRQELEEDNMEDLLSRGVGAGEVAAKISDSKQKYSDYINSSLDSRSVTSDYSTMSSTNIPSFGQSSLDRLDYCPVRSSNSVPRELCYSVPKNQDKSKPGAGLRRDSADRVADHKGPQTHNAQKLKHKSGTQGVGSSHGLSSRDDLEVPKDRGPHRGKTFDNSHKDSNVLSGHGDIGQKAQRKGSLDSLLDIYDNDLSHIDSDGEGDEGDRVGVKKEEGLLESIAHAKPQFKLLSSGPSKTSVSSKHTKPASPKIPSKDLKSVESSQSGQAGNLPRYKSDGLLPDRPFRDPTLHKASAQRDAKVVGIASRFERKDSTDKSLPCYNSDSRLVGGLSSGSRSRGSAAYARQSSKENQAPVCGQRSSSSSERTNSSSSTSSQRAGRTASTQQAKQDSAPSKHKSGSHNRHQYASALRKSSEKIFDSRENLLDLQSPEPESGWRVSGDPLQEKAEPQMRAKMTPQMRDRKNKRRRYTVGGPGDLEHYEALLLATEQNSQRAKADQTACIRLQPKSPLADAVNDVQSWCMQQRLRHADSSPALFDPGSDTPAAEEEPPLKRKGSVKTGEEKAHRAPSRSGSSRSQSTRSSCHSSTPSPSSPGPGSRGIPAPFGFVSTV